MGGIERRPMPKCSLSGNQWFSITLVFVAVLTFCWAIDAVYDWPVRRFLQRRFFPVRQAA
jgi:hypothetical protein